MPATANRAIAIGTSTQTLALDPSRLNPHPFSLSLYGEPAAEIDDLLPSIREHGVLVALVVAPGPKPGTWEVLSGHRRLACAMALGLTEVPCEIRRLPRGDARRRAILEYNRHRRKTFSQLMREADALEDLWGSEASARRLANLRGRPLESTDSPDIAECRDSDDRATPADSDRKPDRNGQPPSAGRGRTDTAIARHLGMGGKDLYRQARAIWRLARSGDARAQSGVAQLDAGTKTIHAAHKDLRRRDRFSADFRPTPYDVWSFRHDRAFGIPHPGSIPPALVAHTLHYYTSPGALVVDPMAGGGTTLDVCESMGRRCLAYDLHPVRPEIHPHDIRRGLPPEADRLRPHLLRPSLSHHAGPAIPPRMRRHRPPLRLDRLPPGSGPSRLRRPPTRRLPRAAPRPPDREGPPRRLRLSRSRLFWLYRGRPRGLPARAADQLPDGRRLSPPARPPGSPRRTVARPGPRPARDEKAIPHTG